MIVQPSLSWRTRPSRPAAPEAVEERALARIVEGRPLRARLFRLVLDAPPRPFAEGVVRPVPALLLEEVDAVAQAVRRAFGS